ncbi:MAG: ORF6N domain-containing protein [Candidatus Gastranaerophilaceae bacterium]
MNELIPTKIIENKILVIRGQKVMIDRDLAELYEVNTKVLNQAVKRNIERFPDNFMFKLNDIEIKELVTNCDRFKSLKHSTSLPYAFTEYGVAMLSSVLNSKRAIALNIQIIQTFIKIKEFALSHKDLSQRISDLERYFIGYAEENNEQIQKINETLNYLIDITKPRTIGFKTK